MTELVVRLSAEDRAAIAVAVVDEQERRGLVAAGPATGGNGSALLPLEAFAAELPPTPNRNWKRWLRERGRLGELPADVALKSSGRWWFRPVEAREWAAAGLPKAGRNGAPP